MAKDRRTVLHLAASRALIARLEDEVAAAEWHLGVTGNALARSRRLLSGSDPLAFGAWIAASAAARADAAAAAQRRHRPRRRR